MKDRDVTFCVCTYNSEKSLAPMSCKHSKNWPRIRVLVVDHESEDATQEIF